MKNLAKWRLCGAVIVFAATLAGCSTKSSTKATGSGAAIRRDSNGETVTPSPSLDRGIARDLDTVFLGNTLYVKYEVSNRIVTLVGDISSQSKRVRAERIAAAVVNVQQVVNELRVQTRQSRSGKR